MNKPLVSIISINYNSLQDTLEFLESVSAITYPNIEVIVVDNASREKPGQTIRARFPDTIVIESSTNLGFAGGNNLGVARARGKYLLFLNNDTLLPQSFLEPMIEFMEKTPDAGMASPKVLYPDRKTIQYAGAIGVSPYTGRGKRIGLFEQDNGQYDSVHATDLGHGAALLVPHHVIRKIGPMPEMYFLYYEEHDWCEHMKRLGFKMYYIGTSHIIHKESISVGGDESFTKVYYLNRNRLLFLLRNFRGFPRIAGALFFLFIALPKNYFKYALRGKFVLANSILKGLRWNITNLQKNLESA